MATDQQISRIIERLAHRRHQMKRRLYENRGHAGKLIDAQVEMIDWFIALLESERSGSSIDNWTIK